MVIKYKSQLWFMVDVCNGGDWWLRSGGQRERVLAGLVGSLPMTDGQQIIIHFLAYLPAD